MILTHVFSLRKDNRHLQRRIKNFEEKYQERRMHRQQQLTRSQLNRPNHSRQPSQYTDNSQHYWGSENSIDLYPELGPNAPLIQYDSNQESSLKKQQKTTKYGTSKDKKSHNPIPGGKRKMAQ